MHEKVCKKNRNEKEDGKNTQKSTYNSKRITALIHRALYNPKLSSLEVVWMIQFEMMTMLMLVLDDDWLSLLANHPSRRANNEGMNLNQHVSEYMMMMMPMPMLMMMMMARRISA